MNSEFKRFFKHTSVYFIGNALNRLGIFLLLPVYTRYLTPGEFGTLELVFVTVAILRTFLGMRFGHATLRFYYEYDNEVDRKKHISTSFIAITFWSLLLTLLFISFSETFSRFVYGNETYSMLFVVGFIVMFFEVVSEVAFAFLRAREQSLIYVIISLVHMVLRVALNIYIVIFLEKGVVGILTGNMIGSSVVWFVLCLIVIKYSGIQFDRSKIKNLFKYSFPLLVAILPALILKNSDRIFLSKYASLEAVGIYALSMRFGIALRSFIIEPFQLGFGPYRFSIMKKENAKEIYAKFLTYFFYVVVFAGLFVSLLSREVIELMASESFRSTYKVIPHIILAIVLGGVIYILQTGILIQKKTIYMPYISIICAVFHVTILFILVPLYGIYGAAYSFIVTTCISMVITFKFSQHCYSIRFEYGRLFKIMITAFVLFFLALFTEGFGYYERILMKTAMFLTFPVLLAVFGFYSKQEIETLFALKEKAGIKVISTFKLIKEKL